MLSALGLKLVLFLCILVSVLLIIIIVIILLCCYNVRAAITAKANCKPMWFKRYFLDPKESRKEISDPENGSSTRSRHNTRLTLINGSLYFWRSAGRKSKEQKKKSSLLDPTESKNKDPEVDDESKDVKDANEPPSLIVKDGHNIYEDYEEDETWLAASHLSSEATEKATLSGEEKKEKKDQEFPARPTTKSSETGEKGKVSKVELKTNIKKDPKKKKSMDVDDLEQKTKANTKQKKMSLEVIPEDESATLKKRKKKEKKKKISSNDTKGVEESNVVKNIGAHFEEKSMPDSKEPIIVLVDNHEYEEHEADGTKLATSHPSKRLSADMKNLISKIESQSALVMSTGSGNMARASVTSDGSDEVIPLSKGGPSSTALLGRSASPKPGKLARASVTSDGSDEVIPLSKGGLSSTALLGRSASPKPGKLARASATLDGSDEIILLSKGGLSSTALLGRAASPKPGRKDPRPSAGPTESNTHPKKEEVQSTFAGRVKASITKAFGQRKPIDMEEMERRIRENAKPKSSFEEDNEGSSSKKNKKKNKKKASMPDEEDRDGYISVDIKPSAKAERDEVVGKDGYVDIKTVVLRKTKKLVESSDHSDEKDGYVPVEMPVEQSQSTSTALKRARDDSILTKPNSAYGIEKFSSTNSGDGVKFKSTGVKGHNLTDSGSSTPDGDYPYEYVRDQSIIKLRKKK